MSRTFGVLLVLLAVLAASSGCAPSERQTTAELVGSSMLARVDSVVGVRFVQGRGSGSDRRPYRQAAVLHDRAGGCDRSSSPRARCGAIVEVYRGRDRAKARMAELTDFAGVALRRGPLVLRVGDTVDDRRARRYVRAFRVATRRTPT